MRLLSLMLFFAATGLGAAPLPIEAPTPAAVPTLVPSPVAQLFVHPLLAYPERAFVPTSKDLSRMDEWFVTVREFEKTLASLAARGYVLVRASEVFQVGPDRVSLTVPALPPGKRPLLLSVDDLNYYPYMRANGTVSRLSVDAEGRLTAETAIGGGRYRAEPLREVPQIVEAFVAAHPDFSYHGARGLIGLTGYAGVLGWPTHQAPGPALEAAQAGAQRAIEALRALGWEFASHSYAHRTQGRQDDMAWLVSEKRWTAEVSPLIGPTPFYILPFGETWYHDPIRWAALRAAGFRVFFGVETTSNLKWQDGLPIAGRVPLDGRGLRHRFGLLSPFVDSKQVWDPLRPATVRY